MLGVVVLIVAIIALRNPKNNGTAAGSATGTSTGSPVGSQSAGPTSHSGSTSPSKHPGTSHASTSTSSSVTSSGSSSPSSSSAVGSEPLVVLNQGLLTGTAAAAAQRFQQAGWKVTSTNENYVNDVVTTTAYYDPGVSGAKAAAEALQKQFPTIHRVAERFANLAPQAPVVVVLTSDYSPN